MPQGVPLAVVEEAARPLRQVTLTTALPLTLAVPLAVPPAVTLALALTSCSTTLALSRRRSSACGRAGATTTPAPPSSCSPSRPSITASRS